LANLIEAANRFCNAGARKTPALVVRKRKAPGAVTQALDSAVVVFHRPDLPAYPGELARAGGNAVARIAGAGWWECVEMVRQCAHLASDHLVHYADRMSGLRLVHNGEAATIGLRATK
jgi:hypothetical protein